VLTDPVPDTDSGSLSTSRTIAEQGILRDLIAHLIQSPADVHDTRWNDCMTPATLWQRSGRHPHTNPD